MIKVSLSRPAKMSILEQKAFTIHPNTYFTFSTPAKGLVAELLMVTLDTSFEVRKRILIK